MAKIDVTKIEGYEAMTLEQKNAALEAYEFDDGSAEIERYKNAASKANSEAAEWKKKHNLLLSEEEQKKIIAEEEMTNIKTELENLRKDKEITAHKAKLISIGYDEALADETANAIISGDTEKVFANQKKFLDLKEKAIRKELLKETPSPAPGAGGETLTKEKFKKMGLADKQKLASENPDIYKKMTEE